MSISQAQKQSFVILSSLLDKMLNSKLSPLEHRNENEMQTLSYLSTSSQKIINELNLIKEAKHAKEIQKANQRQIVSKSPILTIKNKPKQKTRNGAIKRTMTKNVTAKSYTPTRRNNTNIINDNNTNNGFRLDTSIGNISVHSRLTKHNKTPIANNNTKLKNKKIFVVNKKEIPQIKKISPTSTNSTSQKSSRKGKAVTPTPMIQKRIAHNETITNLIEKEIIFAPNPDNNNQNHKNENESINFLNLPEIRLSSIPITNTKKESDNSLCESEHFSLGDKLETNFESISKYLTNDQLINFTVVNKQLGINAINTLIVRTETEIEEINNNISQILKIYNPEEEKNKLKTHFAFTKTAIRAIQILNEKNADSLFISRKIAENHKKDILIIYNILLCLITQKNIHKMVKDDNVFWKYICEYFIMRKNRNVIPLGTFIENEIKSVNLESNNELIYKIYSISYSHLQKLKPNYYQNICKTTGIIVFIIKDILDYLGISKDRNVSSSKIYKLLNARIEMQNRFLTKLNSITSKFFN